MLGPCMCDAIAGLWLQPCPMGVGCLRPMSAGQLDVDDGIAHPLVLGRETGWALLVGRRHADAIPIPRVAVEARPVEACRSFAKTGAKTAVCVAVLCVSVQRQPVPNLADAVVRI